MSVRFAIFALAGLAFCTAFAAPRLAFQVYAIRDLCEKDFEGTLRTAKAMGYEGVETGRFYGRSGAELKVLLDKVGLELVALQFYPSELVEPKLRKTIDFAHTAGARRINVAWYKGSSENINDWRLLVDVVNHAAEVCAREGIEIGYHNHDQEFRIMFDGKLVCEWLFENFSPLVKQEFDPGWCQLAGADPIAWLGAHPHRNPTMHIMPAIADAIGLKPGDAGVGSQRDSMDWMRFLPLCNKDGVKWYIVKPTAFPVSMEDLKASCEFMKLREMRQ